MMDELYKDIEMDIDDLFEESVRDDDPVKSYIIARLTNQNDKIDYNNVELSTVVTFTKILDFIVKNMNLKPEALIEKAPSDIRKYISFIAGGYHGKYFNEEIGSIRPRNNDVVDLATTQRNI